MRGEKKIMKSERFACITMLCSFQKTQKEMTERENSKIKWYWNLTGSVSIFFFHILLTVNKMQTKVTVIGHKNTMPHNLCPIRESNWSTESTCQVSLESLSSKLSCSAKNKVFFSFFLSDNFVQAIIIQDTFAKLLIFWVFLIVKISLFTDTYPFVEIINSTAVFCHHY